MISVMVAVAISGNSGSVMATVSVFAQPVASVTTNVYTPAMRESTRVLSDNTSLDELIQEYVYGPKPPDTVDSMDPEESPLH